MKINVNVLAQVLLLHSFSSANIIHLPVTMNRKIKKPPVKLIFGSHNKTMNKNLSYYILYVNEFNVLHSAVIAQFYLQYFLSSQITHNIFLGEGNLIFLLHEQSGELHQVSWQNNNPKFQHWHI